jgi:YVTN family beta-propeller protein
LSLLRFVVLQALLTISLIAQSTLAVVEKKAGKVGFYSIEGRRLGEIQVGAFPHEMAFSPDRRFLYVTDNGMLWMTDKGEGGNTISIIDVAARKKAGVIDLGNHRRPHGLAVVPGTGEIVVTIENPYGLLRVDPTARKVVRKYDVGGDSPHMVLVGPTAGTAWVSNSGSGTVAVLDLASGAIQTQIPTGKNTQGCVMSRDGKRIYVTNSASNSVSIVDVQKRKVEREIATGAGPNRVFLSPDEKTLLYSMQAGAAMGFADTNSARETARIKLPGPPLSLALSSDKRTAYLGIQDSDKIVVISVPQKKIVLVFNTPPGAGPDSIEPL